MSLHGPACILPVASASPIHVPPVQHVLIKHCGAHKHIIEYSSTLYVGLQLKQNGHPYKAMVRTDSKSRIEAFIKLQKVSSLHYHEFL